MTDTDRAVERLRSANPLPGIEHVDADELGLFVSYFEERRDVMNDSKAAHRGEPALVKPRRLQPALVFVVALVACLVVVGAAALLMRGEESSVEPAAPATTVQEATTVAETTVPDTTPPTTMVHAPAAAVASLSDRSEYFAGVTVGPDGLPIVASYAFNEADGTGMVRLFSCADTACEEAEIVELMEAPWIGRTLELMAAPNGDLYLLVGESVLVYRDGELATLPLMFNWPSVEDMAVAELPIAFTEDARPVFAGAMGEQGLTLVVCDDATCAGQTEVPLEANRFLNAAGAMVEGDTIRVVYAVGTPTGPPDPEAGYDGADMMRTTKIATVSDIDGTPAVNTVIVYEGLNAFPTNVEVDADGNLVVWMYSWQGEHVSYSVLSCRDGGCADADAVGLGGWAFRSKITPDMRPINVVAESVYDPEEYAAYLEEERRIAEERLDLGAEEPEALGTNLVVIECVDTTCTASRRSTIAAMEGWWYLNSLGIGVAQDGTVYVLIGSDAGVGDPGLWLHSYPEATLGDMVEPYVGTAVIDR